MSICTPWGLSQANEEIAPGINTITTASHGGYRLNAQRLAEMPPSLRSFQPFAGAGWYEEDVDWAVVVVAFPQFFSAEHIQSAKQSIEHTVEHYADSDTRYAPLRCWLENKKESSPC